MTTLKPFDICANCYHPEHLHRGGNGFNKRRTSMLDAIDQHPVFTGMPEEARRMREVRENQVCLCKHGSFVSFGKRGVDVMFLKHPFRLSNYSAPGYMGCNARRMWQVMSRVVGRPAWVGEGMNPFRSVESVFHADQWDVVLERGFVRYMDWWSRHQTWNSTSSSNGIAVPKSSVKEILDSYRIDLVARGDMDEKEINERMEMVQRDHERYVKGTVRTAIHTMQNIKFCACPGYVKLDPEDAAKRAVDNGYTIDD
jgi:hypothetical protein